MILLIGVVLVWARWSGAAKSQRVAKESVVRSWIALSLVTGLLIFCAVAFAIDDSPLRSTLMGALAAAVGSATAFYFSSKSTEQAQQAQKDLVNATVGTETVPKLVGSTQEKAAQALGTTSLKLVTAQSSMPPGGEKVVATQDPVEGAEVVKNTPVTVTYGPGPQAQVAQEGSFWRRLFRIGGRARVSVGSRKPTDTAAGL
ncbi:PASTA domain-containing protein [Streptacidiphilus pinicola]|nr:PASTA domain-containing protein [Streptacidiphilus pinicola]